MKQKYRKVNHFNHETAPANAALRSDKDTVEKKFTTFFTAHLRKKAKELKAESRKGWKMCFSSNAEQNILTTFMINQLRPKAGHLKAEGRMTSFPTHPRNPEVPTISP